MIYLIGAFLLIPLTGLAIGLFMCWIYEETEKRKDLN